MIAWINSTLLAASDPLLGWLLHLPTDLALAIVAVGTGSILAFVRLLTTNQDLLRRCDHDKKRLKELIREARAAKDREAVKRHRATHNMIALMTLRQEGWPLLASIVPIALLGTWCFQRLAFVPPKAGETVTLRAYFPASAAGELAHVAPQDGLREVSAAAPADGGRWIQEIAEERGAKTNMVTGAVATWKLQASARREPYRIEIRHRTTTVTKELLVGQRRYSPDMEFYGGDSTIGCVQTDMQPVKLFGFVPGIRILLLPPWLVAYFLVAIPSVSLIKRAAGIH